MGRRGAAARSRSAAAWLGFAWLGLACGAGPALRPAAPPGRLAAPPRPGVCEAVAPGELAGLLASARPGDSLCLAAGVHPGPLVVDVPVTLWGPRGAVIRSNGEGTTLRLAAAGAALLGVTVDGSGGRFDLLDSAVHVGADDVRVEGVRVVNAVFGILVEKANRVLLRGNDVEGFAGKALGLRGDGIRMWETRDSRVEANHIRDSRDLVVWYSPGNRFTDNVAEGGRYGIHFMYSHDNTVERNRFQGNVVGLFAMYSRDLRIRNNVFAESAGAAGVGLGAKESGSLDVRENLFVGNRVGMYLDTSPLDPRNPNRFEANGFRFSEAALVFHGRAAGNTFRDNDFRDNTVTLRTEGRASALDALFEHNHFDEYAGYDLDGDGLGDVAHEVRSLSQELTARRPGLAFFRGTAALGMVEVVGRVSPIFARQTLLRDAAPRMARPRREPAHAR